MMRHSIVIGGLSIMLAGCTTPLPPLPVAASDPYDLDKHVVELDGRGEADMSSPPYALAVEAGESCNLALVAAPDGEATKVPDDPAVKLRQRFVCILSNALARYQARSAAQAPHPEVDSRLKLAFYFNGGLNAREDAIVTAAQSYRQAEHDGFYPIYMVWPTGALRTYGEDMAQVRAGRFTPWQDPWTLSGTPLRPASDLARGIAGTPAAWGVSAHEFWQTGFGFGNDAFSMAGDKDALILHGGIVGPGHNLFFDDGKTEGSDAINADSSYRNAGEGTQNTASYLYYGAMGPVRVLTTPLVVGLGEAGWRNMVRRTRTSVRSATEFPDEFEPASGPAHDLAIDCADDANLSRSNFKLQHCYPRGAGGFSRFFQWLESCITGMPVAAGADGCPLELSAQERKILQQARITMIGHSMGTIVINELVELYPDLPYESLVYMAAAASTRDTARAVVPILRRNQGCTKLYGLMLHPLNEARESTFYGLLLSGSLLVYVDELLENPKTLPDRTFGQWHNVRMTEQMFPEDVQRWMLFRVFDREAETYRDPKDGKLYRRPNPTTHGMFNDADMPFWQETFWRPQDIVFAPPDRSPFAGSCEELFAGRIEAARTTASAPAAER